MIKQLKTFLKYFRNRYWTRRLLIRTRRNIRKTALKKQKGEKLVVVFFLQYPEMWNSLKSIYDAMCDDDRYSPLILCFPKKKGTYEKKQEFHKKNDAIEFCEKNSMKYIDANSDNKWGDIKRLEPDYIFVQRPYDEYMPKALALSCISKYGLVCYVPYGYEYVNGIHLDIEYNSKLMSNLYASFAENDDTYSFVRQLSKKEIDLNIRKVYNIGFPRFDLVEASESIEKSDTVLWLPRWSVNESNDRSYFFDYKDILLDYFGCHKDKHLIIRPHPLMFDNFVSVGVMTEKEVLEFKDEIRNMQNVKLDENEDYNLTFKESDVLIADFTTLVIEYFLTKKPVIYCGNNMNDFNSVGKKMESGMYITKNKEELIDNLTLLLDGKNPKLPLVREAIDYILKNENVGKCVADMLFQEV